MRPSGSRLTREERLHVIRCALTHTTERFVERQIREALTREGETAAVATARTLCRNWGMLADGWWIDGVLGRGKGIYVKTPDGREDLIRWSELVDYVRGGFAQVSLFDLVEQAPAEGVTAYA